MRLAPVARALAGLLPGEPGVTGLLALLLLADARRAARIYARGDLVLLPDQDRRPWDAAMIAEGERLVEQALRAASGPGHRRGPVPGQTIACQVRVCY
jgi:RNA polymerase sigma-70 factor, ECF subfamily